MEMMIKSRNKVFLMITLRCQCHLLVGNLKSMKTTLLSSGGQGNICDSLSRGGRMKDDNPNLLGYVCAAWSRCQLSQRRCGASKRKVHGTYARCWRKKTTYSYNKIPQPVSDPYLSSGEVKIVPDSMLGPGTDKANTGLVYL